MFYSSGFSVSDLRVQGRTRAEIDRQEWIDHCRRGHVPCRRDCRACVQSGAYPRPHRRQRHPHVLNLQCNLGGPFVTGEDVSIQKPRHLMVVMYLFPSLQLDNSSPEDGVDEDGYKIPEDLLSDPSDGPLHELVPEGDVGDEDNPAPKEAEFAKEEQDKWDTIIASCKQRYKAVTLTFVEVLPDQQATTVV